MNSSLIFSLGSSREDHDDMTEIDVFISKWLDELVDQLPKPRFVVLDAV